MQPRLRSFVGSMAILIFMNPRPLDPQSSALPGCATLRHRRAVLL